MLQYIISVVFLYLKHIFMIFFPFLHEPAERQLMLIMVDSLKDSQFWLLWLSLMCSMSTLGLFSSTYKSLC